MFEESDHKLCIIFSKGSLDMAYPGMVLANAALMEGIEANIFFTFWGLDMITDKRMDNLKCTPLGNPSMAMPNGMGIPNFMAMLPGMTDFSTSMMKKEMEKLGFPPVREYLQSIADAGGKLYACKTTADMMKLTKEDLFDEVVGIVGAMEFLEMAEGAQVIYV
ncbi:MAG TPA: DsrE/DsrF/DrsH-like family protein [candidate division Zixibacteria bacterium]|nr:DsrE/DsrF/DrsH-like family protein [candidate division Zixibacteria bacterium]